MRETICIVTVSLGFALSGCATTRPTFTPEGLHQEPYGYEIAYRDPGAQQFLPEEWRIDNFYRNSWSPKLNAKETPEYMTEIGFDIDGDGKVNTTEKRLAYDLRFENRVTAGAIWLRGVPLAQFDDRKDLRVLMRIWIEQMAGSDVNMWKVGDRVVVVAASYTTKQLDEIPAKLAGVEAFASTFELANAEQLRMSPGARLRRVKLVLVRSGLLHMVGKVGFPVIVIAGVADLPEYFDRSVVEFDKFLNQISIGGRRGYKQLAPLASKEATAAIPPEAPSPPPPAVEARPGEVQDHGLRVSGQSSRAFQLRRATGLLRHRAALTNKETVHNRRCRPHDGLAMCQLRSLMIHTCGTSDLMRGAQANDERDRHHR